MDKEMIKLHTILKEIFIYDIRRERERKFVKINIFFSYLLDLLKLGIKGVHPLIIKCISTYLTRLNKV